MLCQQKGRTWSGSNFGCRSRCSAVQVEVEHWWQLDADAHCLTIALTGRDGDISLLRLNLKQVVNKSRNKCEQKYLSKREKISLLFGKWKKADAGEKG